MLVYIPTASVLSKRETHDKVPGSSSTAGLPVLKLGLAFELVVALVNATIRADGSVYSISIEGSGVADDVVAGRLKDRLTGVEGFDESIKALSQLQYDPLPGDHVRVPSVIDVGTS